MLRLRIEPRLPEVTAVLSGAAAVAGRATAHALPVPGRVAGPLLVITLRVMATLLVIASVRMAGVRAPHVPAPLAGPGLRAGPGWQRIEPRVTCGSPVRVGRGHPSRAGVTPARIARVTPTPPVRPRSLRTEVAEPMLAGLTLRRPILARPVLAEPGVARAVVSGPGTASAASVRATASLIVGLVVIGPAATRQARLFVRPDHLIRFVSRRRPAVRRPAAAKAPASPLER